MDQDLTNIPINRKTHITINIFQKNIEIYINGKLIKTSQLQGVTEFNNQSLYVMYPVTFNGEISNLMYYPNYLNSNQINEIMQLG